MAEQGIQVSLERVNEILASNQSSMILQLSQEIARLTAVNEALIGRINEYSSREASQANGQALIRESVHDNTPGPPVP